ncbi:MBL fold metallo-hydrolase [Halorubellus sp. PRR65]|uniref:MBL fold metallo-hydrolase n=1 Tax=Halorubellus sp. PRR65 TaxID=3098148 RepID=UPI002B25BDC7|nr:MBL fold metallo-hydrolase [Halorubellus sp. PRR65]
MSDDPATHEARDHDDRARDDRLTVERVQVSTAYGSGPEGGNSAWVLPDSGIVVDPGPPGDTAFEHLREGLADVGLAVADVADVLVTHWHVDHAGLAPRLADAADATLHLHERDAPLVADYAAARARRVDRDAAALSRWGVPDEHVASLRDADSPSPMPDETAVDALAASDVVGPLSVVETPGHTAGHVAFALRDTAGGGERTADARVLVGDAVLRTVTPNVGGGDTRQSDPLADYRRALDELAGAGWRALPGHGTAFDLAPRLAELREHHRERAGLVLDSLADLADTEGGDRGVTPWAVARDRFGDMTGYHVKFGAGEAFAHLQDLVALDVVERVDDDPLRYRPVDAFDAVPCERVLDDAWRAGHRRRNV